MRPSLCRPSLSRYASRVDLASAFVRSTWDGCEEGFAPLFTYFFKHMTARSISRPNSCFLLLLFLFTVATLGSAQLDEVTVRSEHGLVQVRVSAAVDLSKVLDRFCSQTHSECDGLSLAEGYLVRTFDAQGDWSQVVSRLMEGSRLNYAAVSPNGAEAGRLLIQGKAIGLTASDVNRGAVAPHEMESSAAAAVPSETAVATAEQSSSPTESNTSSYEPAPQESQGGSGSLANSLTGGMTGSPLTSDMSAVAGSFRPPQVLLFPDAHGNPIPVSAAEPQVLPFPDAHGNPIPVKESPGGSPFPAEVLTRPH